VNLSRDLPWVSGSNPVPIQNDFQNNVKNFDDVEIHKLLILSIPRSDQLLLLEPAVPTRIGNHAPSPVRAASFEIKASRKEAGHRRVFPLEGNLKNAYGFLSEKRGTIWNSGSHCASR
jgi:hypothetical protein